MIREFPLFTLRKCKRAACLIEIVAGEADPLNSLALRWNALSSTRW